MKKLVLALVSFVLLLPAYSSALDLPFLGGDKKGAGEEEDVIEKGEARFQVRFKSGGVIEVDNYTVTEDQVIVMVPSGAIYLDKKMVESIDQVQGAEDETIQTIVVGSEPPAKTEAGEERPEAIPFKPQMDEDDHLITDDDGHTEQWWQVRVNKVEQEKADAEKRHEEAEERWAKADGELQNAQTKIRKNKLVQKIDDEGKPVLDENGAPVFETVEVLEPAASEYDITRLQDQRGSARVEMDRAKADIEEADRMLNEVLPEEARLAGAPPGWVR